ncbi:MAG TPA: TraR/DksA C4-type zinc finger protein [Rariglobus sp.]
MKHAPKPSPKKPAAKPAAKPAPKAVAKAKPSPAAKPAPKSAAPVKSDKPSASSSAKAAKPSAKPPVHAPAPKVAPKAAVSAKASARDSLRSRILEKSKAKEKVRPIAFSLDEIREIAKTAKVEDTKATAKVSSKTTKHIDADKLAKPAQPHHIKAASLADILGFNPKKPKPAVDDAEDIPEKFRRYYKLLVELRNHLTGQIDTHSEETLKRSSKDDAGDLSSYGQHMADAGTDTFDRDFALSLVSSEQEALSEVEAAIKRIKDGTYGICENTQKPIAKERLLAVPFTRYSAEAQKDIEKNRMRSRSQAGLFGELGEEGGTLTANGGGGDGDDE